MSITVRILVATPLAKNASILIALILLAACAPAFAQVDQKDSLEFDWRYEMDVLPSSLDLDRNGTPDFAFTNPSITTDGSVLSIPVDRYVVPSPSGIWRDKFNYATGYTIEARVKVMSQAGGNGAWALYCCASDTRHAGILKVGATDQGWGITEANLGANDNTDDFHVFRVAQAPGANCFSVWRDGQLLATGLTCVHTTPNYFWFGDGTGSWDGSSQVDYIRFTAGAYAPPGSPLPAAASKGAPGLSIR